jgi:cell division protein FtsZ
MLINITAGMDIALFEVDEAVNRVRSEVDPDANVIFGSTFDPTMEGRLRVSVVATGIDAGSATQQQPVRQPTLDVIRGGVDGPARKSSLGSFAAMSAAAPIWPAASVGAMSQPITLTATAQQLEPIAIEMVVAPEAIEVAAIETSLEPALGLVTVAPAPIAAQTASIVAPEPAQESFIPARPVEQATRQATHQQYAPQPAQPSTEKKRGYSLFERVTGAARRAENGAAQASPQPQRAIPTLGTGTPARAHSPESSMPLASQARLGIDAAARPKASTPEDDLLEIPAFLRRQAN